MSAPADLLDRTPPAADDAERAVLGSIILRPAALDDIGATLRFEDFRLAGHRALYRHLVAMHAAREGADEITLATRLKAAGDWNLVGGVAGLAAIASGVAVASHAAHYARLVVRAAQRRRMLEAGVRLIQAAHDDGVEPADGIAGAEAEMAAIATCEYSDGAVSAQEAAAEFCVHVDAVRERKRNTGLLTGFPDYDQTIGGLFGGELIVLAARPAQGKTALMLQLCHRAAAQGEPTLIISLEMSRLELTTRLVCGLSGVDSRRVRTGSIGGDEAARLAEAANSIALYRLAILDRPAITVADIRRVARQASRRDGLALLGVDYLQLIRPADAKAPREQQVAGISRDLKCIARELDIPVLVACQLSRASEQSDEPQLHHLRESGAIEQDADVVMFLQRGVTWSDEEPAAANQAKLTLRKNRNGPLASCKLRWVPHATRFHPPYEAFEEFSYAS